jgi:glycosyltransferase involved in cell wall biosynthesis
MNAVQIFNSSVLSGPEKLILDNLSAARWMQHIIFLKEIRIAVRGTAPWRYARELGFEVTEIPVRGRIDHIAVHELAACIVNLNVSVVHAHDVKASWYTNLARNEVSHNVGFFSTHHGVRGRSGFRARLYESFYVKRVLGKFSKALCVCDSDRRLLIERGLSPEQVVLHANALPELRFVPVGEARQRLRAIAGLSEYDPAHIFVYLGRLEREKNPAEVLRFFKAFCELTVGETSHLILFGEGSLHADLQGLVRTLSLQDRVHFAGHQTAAASYLSGANGLFLFSRAEGLPLCLLEAGAAQVPLVVNPVDGICDVAPDEQFATFHTPGTSPISAARRWRDRLTSGEALDAAVRLKERLDKHFSHSNWIKTLRSIYE